MTRVFAIVLLCAAPALADTKKPAPAPAPRTTQPPPQPPAEHKEGEYGGVVPGQPQPKDTRPKHPVAKGVLSWIGFEAKDGGATIFLQSAAAFEVTQHVEGAILVVNLAGVTRLGHNVWRPIDTRFFDTTVARVVARQVGAAKASKSAPAHAAGIEVRVAFKNAKDTREATVRTATEADGLYYAYLSFGSSVVAPSSTKEPE